MGFDQEVAMKMTRDGRFPIDLEEPAGSADELHPREKTKWSHKAPPRILALAARKMELLLAGMGTGYGEGPGVRRGISCWTC